MGCRWAAVGGVMDDCPLAGWELGQRKAAEKHGHRVCVPSRQISRCVSGTMAALFHLFASATIRF